MPSQTVHTVITWIPGSTDGIREAKRLHTRFKDNSQLCDPSKLTQETLSRHMYLIVVGHRSELSESGKSQLAQLFSGINGPVLVLALCESAQARYQGPLRDNELSSPAQQLANRLKVEVKGTSRPLTFDEVGQGHAFALALGEVLIPNNVTSSLWVSCRAQTGLEEITSQISNL